MNLQKLNGNLCLLSIILIIFEVRTGLSQKTGKEDLTPCQTAALLPAIRTDFMKLIPVFNPDRFAIQLYSERRLTLRPTDPGLNPFLIRYYTLVISTINELEARNARIRNPMLLIFNSLYLNFLAQTGVPMSCVSFYAGRSEFQSVAQVRQLSARLQKRFGEASVGSSHGQAAALHQPSASNHFHFGVLGKDLAGKLGLSTGPFVSTLPTSSENARNNCETIFLTLQDGSVLTNLPSVSIPPDSIKVPGEQGPIQTQRTNVTFILSRYFATGLNCLDSNTLKGNFSATFSNWISSKLIPALLSSPNCISGFPGILNLMKSIYTYSSEVKNSDSFTGSRMDGNLAAYRTYDSGQLVNQQQSQIQQTYNFQQADNYNRGDEAQQEIYPNAGRLYGSAPAYFSPPQQSQYNNYAPAQGYAPLQQTPPVYDEPVPPAFEFGEYAPLQQASTGPPPSDGYQNEVYKISPKFNYLLQDVDTGLDMDNTTASDSSTSALAAAGIGTIFLFIIICCICPLIYFLCPPSTKNIKKGKAKMFKFIRKRIPPPPPERKYRRSERYDDADLEQAPLLRKPILKKSKRRSKSKRTKVNIKLNERQVAEVSINETTDSGDSPLTDEEEYETDDEIAIGGTKARETQLPATHTYRKPSPSALAFESTASGTSNSDLFDEDEVNRRYDRGPVMDPNSPSSKRLDQAISSQLAAASVRQGPPALPKTRPPKWPNSEVSTATAGSPQPIDSRESSKDFFENAMVKWDE